MQGGDIFIESDDGAFVSLTAAPYGAEDELQSLLERNPALLGGRQMREADPVRFVLVRRESGVPADEQSGDRWSIDHLFLDQHAVPTLVEVKRSSDTRIRRAVVGQMLDYAANAVAYWSASRLRAEFEETCRSRSLDPVAEIAALFGKADVDLYWQEVAANLRTGRLRLVFVADVIPPELCRIIEYLNAQMALTEVFGVELHSYVADGVRVLAPTVLGRCSTVEADTGAASTEAMDVGALFDAAPTAVHEAARLLDKWAEWAGLSSWDQGQSRRYAEGEGKGALVSLYPGHKWEAVYVDLAAVPSEPARSELQARLSNVAEKQVTPKNPGISCKTVVDRWDDLLATFLVPYIEACRSA